MLQGLTEVSEFCGSVDRVCVCVLHSRCVWFVEVGFSPHKKAAGYIYTGGAPGTAGPTEAVLVGVCVCVGGGGAARQTKVNISSPGEELNGKKDCT